jgi:hypothetical protein
VQHGSRIEIEFSPESEQLIIHTINVHRAEGVVNLRPGQSVRVLHREREMERFVFNGRLLAVLLLDSIRAGDTVDYSYSLQATKEPLFGRTTGRFLVQSTFAAQALRCRLVYQPQRLIFAQPHNCALKPEVTLTPDGLVDCRWQLDGIKPLATEEDTPPWALPFCWIDYGEFGNWEEVAQAASRLFIEFDQPLYPELSSWVHEMQRNASSPEEFIIQIIRYVQDQVRYVAVAIDEHACKPYDIATILGRHYGDCKDKTILLCQFLREAGFDALPVLVHSDFRGSAAQGLPSPSAFNHAIARLRHDGRTHWIDGTLMNQGGRLGNISHAALGIGLVLCSPGEALEAIPASPSVDLASYDELAKVHSRDGLVELRISRVFTGAAADGIRHLVSSIGLEEIERRLIVDYQAAYGEEVSLAFPVTFEDRRGDNRITLIHNLMLANIWKPANRTSSVNQARFIVHGIQGVLRLPKEPIRVFPYLVGHPLNLSASLEVRLPSAFKPQRSYGVIRSPAFQCKHVAEVASNWARTNFEYISTMDHVTVKDLGRHAEAIKQLARLATTVVTIPENKVSRGSRAGVHR